MIHTHQRKLVRSKKVETHQDSNLQAKEIHISKILKMLQVINFKIVLQEQVKLSKKS